nr:probable peroxygenase 4 [Nicotiana tomentosiformis]
MKARGVRNSSLSSSISSSTGSVETGGCDCYLVSRLSLVLDLFETDSVVNVPVYVQGKWPSPLFPIEVKNIKFAKHGSDSDVYDTEGRFVPEKFEELFKKHARTNGNALTASELDELLKANKQPKDFAGHIAAKSEWKVLYLLCKDEHGLLPKDTVRSVYDGSLFELMAKAKQSKKHGGKSSP